MPPPPWRAPTGLPGPTGRRLGAVRASDLPGEAEEVWRYSGIDAFDLEAFAPAHRRRATRARRDRRSTWRGRLAEPLGARVRVGGDLQRRGRRGRARPRVVQDGSMILTSVAAVRRPTGRHPDWAGLFARPVTPSASSTTPFWPMSSCVSVPPKAVVRDPVVVVHLVDPPEWARRRAGRLPPDARPGGDVSGAGRSSSSSVSGAADGAGRRGETTDAGDDADAPWWCP